MTRRVYIAGPMSRESFCRCDRPSARSTLPIAADLIGAGVWDYNYPAFTRAAATLRNQCYRVEQSIEQRDGVAVLEGLWPCPTARALDAETGGES